MPDKEIIVDGVDVSACYQYMPRYMEDYDIDTLNYCRYHFKPCKDVDVKYCYYKQLKRKEQEVNKYKQALNEVEKFCKDVCDSCKKFTPNRQSDISCRFCQSTQILDIINKVKEK